MEIGQVVTRKSYNNDIRFIIKNIIDNKAILSGIDQRLLADSTLDDLKCLKITRDNSDYELKKSYEDKLNNRKLKYIIAKLFTKFYLDNKERYDENNILHIDGDRLYLSLCMEQYRQLGLKVVGISINENEQPKAILELLKRINPNILIITGHDSLKREKINSLDINDYKNSKYYVESVKIARNYNNDYNDLVIFAGGCKSFYEAIMNAGANFASSPNRILIDIMYPVYLAFKIAITSKYSTLSIEKIAKEFSFDEGSIGGILTKGQLK